MKRRIAATIATVVLAVTAATIAGKGEVSEFKDGDIEKWAQTFSVEVRETLIENWNWTGDNAAKINALEQRVAQLESHSHNSAPNPTQSDSGQSSGNGSNDNSDSSNSRQRRSEGTEDPPNGSRPNESQSSPAANLDELEPTPTPSPTPTAEPMMSCTHRGNTYSHNEVWTWESNVAGQRWRHTAKCHDGRVIPHGSTPLGPAT